MFRLYTSATYDLQRGCRSSKSKTMHHGVEGNEIVEGKRKLKFPPSDHLQ